MSVEKKKKNHVLHAMGNIAVHETIFISAREKTCGVSSDTAKKKEDFDMAT